ncbi:BrnT family toxin [Inquilinus limosus]|uniref:BrnT family toxin n=1 Tax=Inquilinus limosus TaxID=171674 RepID=UPI003F17D632
MEYLYQWDKRKAEKVWRDRGIAFEDLPELIEGRATLTSYSPRNGEDRFETIGALTGHVLVVIWMYTEEPKVRRIITARKARPYEKELYRDRIAREGPSEDGLG